MSRLLFGRTDIHGNYLIVSNPACFQARSSIQLSHCNFTHRVRAFAVNRCGIQRDNCAGAQKRKPTCTPVPEVQGRSVSLPRGPAGGVLRVAGCVSACN